MGVGTNLPAGISQDAFNARFMDNSLPTETALAASFMKAPPPTGIGGGAFNTRMDFLRNYPSGAPPSVPTTMASLPATPQIRPPMDIRPRGAITPQPVRPSILGRLLGGLAGGALGGPVGGLLGGFLGGRAGTGIGNLFSGRGTIPNVATQLSNLQAGGGTSYGGYTPTRYSAAAAPMSPSGGSQYAYTTGSGPQGQRATSYTTNSGRTITFYTDPGGHTIPI